jgi:hypothetical protein
MAVDLSELYSERLPLLQIAFRQFHQFIQPLALVVAAYGLMHRAPHHLHRVALLKEHEGKGCRRTCPPQASTYLLTRLLVWLESLSTAMCNGLWQR